MRSITQNTPDNKFTPIAFTLTAMIALIQVLDELSSLFGYPREKYRRKRQVKSVISLSSLHSQPLFVQELSTLKSVYEVSKFREMLERVEKRCQKHPPQEALRGEMDLIHR